MNTVDHERGDSRPEVVLERVYDKYRSREARRRSRRVAAMACAVALILLVVTVTLVPHHESRKVVTTVGPDGTLPIWSAVGPAAPEPAVFVDGNDDGGIGLWSTASGRLIRTLSAQTRGGPDQQPELSADRRSVYFARPTGICTGVIDRVPLTGAKEPVTVIASPGVLAIEPSPSPDGRQLAWIGTSCRGRKVSDQLYVTNLDTGFRRDLGTFSGNNADDAIAWSRDSDQLAVERGRTVTLLDLTARTPLLDARTLRPPSGCNDTDPAYLAGQRELAVIETCQAETVRRSSRVIAVDLSTGRAVALIAKAPRGTTFAALSVDRSGQHLLLAESPGSRVVDVVDGQLEQIDTDDAPSSEEW